MSCCSSSTLKGTLLRSPSVSNPSEQVSPEALLKLALLLKELHLKMRRRGYTIINGKIVKTTDDSAKLEKDGIMP